MSQKKILFITGTRADYGKIKALMSAIQNEPGFELYVYVTGMHLSELHGSTYLGIQKDGWHNIQVDFGAATHEDGMAQNLSNIVASLSNYIRALKPDLTVIHGDRIEALSGAISSVLQNIRTAHIEGGEVSGTIDESIRHAISKLSHEHFVASSSARDRLSRLGEEAERIHIIGSPDIDLMLSDNLPSLVDVKKYYNIPFEQFFIAMLHPVTTNLFSLRENSKIFVKALNNCGLNGIVIYPNNDLGHETILSEYSSFDSTQFRIFPSIRFESFLTLLKHCKFIIGNSSAGIREAGIYGTPAIDIGSRQQGRFNLKKLLHLQHIEFDYQQILYAISQTDKFHHPSMTFGTGNSASQFISILKSPDFWSRPIRKVLTY